MTKYESGLRGLLEKEIVEGRLAPGDRLDEATLAKRFDVSRTPVREALLQLRAVGLVDMGSKKGATVSAPSISTVIEMFETMSEMESVCGRLAARRMQPDDQAAILGAHERCGEAAREGDLEAYYHHNAAFHGAIFAATRNGFLAEQTTALHRRLAPLRLLVLRRRNQMTQSLAEHQAIVDALLSGNEDATAEAIKQHSFTQGSRFSDFSISLSSMGFRAD